MEVQSTRIDQVFYRDHIFIRYFGIQVHSPYYSWASLPIKKKQFILWSCKRKITNVNN